MPIRILLVTVFTAALMLTVRLADLWQGVSQIAGSVTVGSPAAAADAATPPAKKKTAANAAASSKQEAALTPAGGAKSTAAGKAPAGGSAKAGAATHAAPDTSNELRPPLVSPDKSADDKGGAKAAKPSRPQPPDGYSDAELDALQSLAKRREELDAREKALDTRAGLLDAGEKRVDQKIAELKGIESKIQGLLKNYNEQETAKLKSLVKIYESMKPKDAAPIFEKLDMDILLDVIERMKERKVAPILARMNPAKAKEITDELARRHELSQAAGAGGM